MNEKRAGQAGEERARRCWTSSSQKMRRSL
ncbi:unnamed protein product [Staurois parvus]|uniref:Uncharacterized protein n=1 Tax=Staurois parvus TaxID=386267 RepID=A0ABN9C8X7_9NEOB|nr:unnamed protein product [Staurois parvus]